MYGHNQSLFLSIIPLSHRIYVVSTFAYAHCAEIIALSACLRAQVLSISINDVILLPSPAPQQQLIIVSFAFRASAHGVTVATRGVPISVKLKHELY